VLHRLAIHRPVRPDAVVADLDQPLVAVQLAIQGEGELVALEVGRAVLGELYVGAFAPQGQGGDPGQAMVDAGERGETFAVDARLVAVPVVRIQTGKPQRAAWRRTEFQPRSGHQIVLV